MQRANMGSIDTLMFGFDFCRSIFISDAAPNSASPLKHRSQVAHPYTNEYWASIIWSQTSQHQALRSQSAQWVQLVRSSNNKTIFWRFIVIAGFLTVGLHLSFNPWVSLNGVECVVQLAVLNNDSVSLWLSWYMYCDVHIITCMLICSVHVL